MHRQIDSSDHTVRARNHTSIMISCTSDSDLQTILGACAVAADCVRRHLAPSGTYSLRLKVFVRITEGANSVEYSRCEVSQTNKNSKPVGPLYSQQ